MTSVEIMQSQQIAQALSNIGDMTKITRCFAAFVLIVNIILPGVGTMIGGCIIGGAYGKGLVCTGVIQLILAPCLIGWIWSILTGVALCKIASNPQVMMAMNQMSSAMQQMQINQNELQKIEAQAA